MTLFMVGFSEFDPLALAAIALVVFGAVAIIVSYHLRVQPTWDMGRVFNICDCLGNI